MPITTLSMRETAEVMGTSRARVSVLIKDKKLAADMVLDLDEMAIKWRVHVDSIRKRITWLTEQSYINTEDAQACLERLDKILNA